MRRRSAGVLVIALTLLAAVIVPNIGARAVRGFPVAAQIPGPPAVGDCLLTALSLMTGPDGTFGGIDPALGPCSGSRFGEVVLVHDAGTLAAFAPGDRITNPQDDSCYSATQVFLGLPDPLVDSAPQFSYWFPADGGATMELAPTDLQRAAGHTWTACVVLAIDDQARSLPYPTSARDAFSTGTPPAAFASCTDIADIAAFQRVDCDTPHRIEVFGYSGDLQGATAPSLNQTCTDLVTRQTRMPDPTAGGTLQIRPALGHYDQDGVLHVGLRESPGGFADVAICRVIAPDDRPLAGTLLGLGERPVPWA